MTLRALCTLIHSTVGLVSGEDDTRTGSRKIVKLGTLMENIENAHNVRLTLTIKYNDCKIVRLHS